MRKIQNKPQPQIAFTIEGLTKVKQQLADYQAKRPAAVESLRIAREMGDLSENGAYKAARFQLSDIDRQIRWLTYQIRYAVVVKKSNQSYVTFGSTVTVELDDKQQTFALVGGYESNPLEKKLSVHSPIGKALINKSVGDTVSVAAPAGEKKYKIISIT